MNEKIYFITTNMSKFEGYSLCLKDYPIDLLMLSESVYEPQSFDPIEIIKSKLFQVKAKHPDIKFVVDDRSAFIPALNNFPGPYLKPAIKTLKADGFLKLMDGQKRRDITFTTAVGYHDGQTDHILIHKERGQILMEKRGSNLRGWSDILKIYASAELPHKSVAQMTDKEWTNHLRINDKTKDIQKMFSSSLDYRTGLNINKNEGKQHKRMK